MNSVRLEKQLQRRLLAEIDSDTSGVIQSVSQIGKRIEKLKSFESIL